MQKLVAPTCALLSALYLVGCGGVDPQGSGDGTDSEPLRRPPIGTGPLPTVFDPPDPDPPDPPPPSLETIVSGYQNYDINGDGIV